MILVDAGPLVALVDSEDQHHADCFSTFQGIREPLGTVWPALVEVMYFLSDLPAAQDAIWEMIDKNALELMNLGMSDVPRIRALMHKYADRPMDLADAALIAVAEREGIQTIFTVDKKDFAVYRLHGRTRMRMIP